MKRLILTFLLLLNFGLTLNAKLLDKIILVVNDKIYTLSEIRQIKRNFPARKQVAPLIYSQYKAINTKEIINLIIQKNVIRSKISELGFEITDEQVESQIKETEKRLRITRDQLLDFLEGNKITFEEYFEITKESIEYNLFFNKIILPSISITKQEIKNTYYKINKNKKTISFIYDLISFQISKKQVKKLHSFKVFLKEFQMVPTFPSVIQLLMFKILDK